MHSSMCSVGVMVSAGVKCRSVCSCWPCSLWCCYSANTVPIVNMLGKLTCVAFKVFLQPVVLTYGLRSPGLYSDQKRHIPVWSDFCYQHYYRFIFRTHDDLNSITSSHFPFTVWTHKCRKSQMQVTTGMGNTITNTFDGIYCSSGVTHIISEHETVQQSIKALCTAGADWKEGMLILKSAWLSECIKTGRLVEVQQQHCLPLGHATSEVSTSYSIQFCIGGFISQIALHLN